MAVLVAINSVFSPTGTVSWTLEFKRLVDSHPGGERGDGNIGALLAGVDEVEVHELQAKKFPSRNGTTSHLRNFQHDIGIFCCWYACSVVKVDRYRHGSIERFVRLAS